jgi:hypothetical protein
MDSTATSKMRALQAAHVIRRHPCLWSAGTVAPLRIRQRRPAARASGRLRRAMVGLLPAAAASPSPPSTVLGLFARPHGLSGDVIDAFPANDPRSGCLRLPTHLLRRRNRRSRRGGRRPPDRPRPLRGGRRRDNRPRAGS